MSVEFVIGSPVVQVPEVLDESRPGSRRMRAKTTLSTGKGGSSRTYEAGRHRGRLNKLSQVFNLRRYSIVSAYTILLYTFTVSGLSPLFGVLYCSRHLRD